MRGAMKDSEIEKTLGLLQRICRGDDDDDDYTDKLSSKRVQKTSDLSWMKKSQKSKYSYSGGSSSSSSSSDSSDSDDSSSESSSSSSSEDSSDSDSDDDNNNNRMAWYEPNKAKLDLISYKLAQIAMGDSDDDEDFKPPSSGNKNLKNVVTFSPDDSSTSSCSDFSFNEYSTTEEGDEELLLESTLSDIDLNVVVKEQRNVHFGNVSLREYSLTVGAHTASNCICPWQLDWEHSKEIEMSVSEYNSWKQEKEEKGNGNIRILYRGGEVSKAKRWTASQRRSRIAQVLGISTLSVREIERDVKVEELQQRNNANGRAWIAKILGTDGAVVVEDSNQKKKDNKNENETDNNKSHQRKLPMLKQGNARIRVC